jgi:peptidyl-prolyl cis-trans isomerase C
MVLSMALSFWGCRDPAASSCVEISTQQKGPAVASFEGGSLTEEEVRKKWDALPDYVRARHAGAEKKREFISGLALHPLLVREAIRRGLHRDAEVRDAAEKVLVQRLLQSVADESTAALTITEEEIRSSYEANIAEYVRLPSVRLSQIFLAAPSPEAKAQRKAAAQELLAKARTLDRMDFWGFAQLAEQLSEDEETRARDGDLGWKTEEDLAKKYGVAVHAAAKKLRQLGEVSDVVESPAGLHLLKLQSRQAALNLKLEQVRGQIENRLRADKRRTHNDRFVESLKEKARYRLDDAAISRMQLTAPAPKEAGRAP